MTKSKLRIHMKINVWLVIIRTIRDLMPHKSSQFLDYIDIFNIKLTVNVLTLCVTSKRWRTYDDLVTHCGLVALCAIVDVWHTLFQVMVCCLMTLNKMPEPVLTYSMRILRTYPCAFLCMIFENIWTDSHYLPNINELLIPVSTWIILTDEPI